MNWKRSKNNWPTFYKVKGKFIIISAPSGAGKTSIVRHLMQSGLGLEFSISATSRPPRPEEENGVDYARCEKLIVAANDEQLARLDKIRETAAGNGVDDLVRLSAAQVMPFAIVLM